MKRPKLYLLSIMLLAVSFTACKKNDVPPVDTNLIGTWQTVPGISAGQGISYSYVFNSDRTYTNKISFFGYLPGQTAQDISAYTMYEGNYSTQSNKLRLYLDATVNWDGSNGLPPKRVAAPKPDTVSNGIDYHISKDTLIFTYYSYPADAPVLTTMKYVKQK